MRNPQVRRTKKLLFQALIELMRRKPYNKITIQDLVSEAELSRTAYYTHYESLNEVLLDYLGILYRSYIEHSLSPDRTTPLTQYENNKLLLQGYWNDREIYVLLRKNNLDHLAYIAKMNNYDLTSQLVSRTLMDNLDDVDLYYSIYTPYHREAENKLIMEWLSEPQPKSIDYMASLITSISGIDVYNAFKAQYYRMAPPDEI